MDAASNSRIKKTYKYISQDSLQNAKKVIDEIILLADKLPDQPEMFLPDNLKYERGEATPASDILNRIAKALDVTTDFLMNGTMQINPQKLSVMKNCSPSSVK